MVSLSCVASFKAFCNTNVTVSFPLFLLVSTRHLPIQQTAAPPDRIASQAHTCRHVTSVRMQCLLSQTPSWPHHSQNNENPPANHPWHQKPSSQTHTPPPCDHSATRAKQGKDQKFRQCSKCMRRLSFPHGYILELL